MLSESISDEWRAVLTRFPVLNVHESGECYAQGELANPAAWLLPKLGVITINGPDTANFLQGQLTADCIKLSSGESVFAAHCNPKGRAISNFFLHKVSDEEFVLVLPCNNLDNALNGLKKYAVFSKVTLSDSSKNFLVVGESTVELAVVSHRIRIGNTLSIALVDSQQPKQTAALIDQLAGESVGGTLDWAARVIQLGFPLVDAASSGEHIAQMLNMDLLDGISFDKGCYTGQEVIARLKYKGEAKRRCYRFSAPLSKPNEGLDPFKLPFNAGDVLIGASEQTVGEIVNITAVDKCLMGLAILKHSAIENGAQTTNFMLRSRETTAEGQNISEMPCEIDPTLPPYAINN